jgi:hypothetical protein
MPERWQHELRKLKTLEPPAGLWDRAMAGPRRKPPRARRTWRVIAPVAAALAVAVVAGTLALVRAFSPAPGGPGFAANHHAGHFTDPLYGWSIRVPAGLIAHHFLNPGRVTMDGVRVTSFPPDLRAPNTGTPAMGWLRTFPADGVAVQIWSGEGGPVAVLGPPRDSAFPLSPSSFQRIRPYVGGTEPRPWYCDCSGDGISFNAAVWIGPHASRAEQHAAWAVVRSLRFPELREGTIWHGYYVLGRASRYPAGSVTTFPVASLPGNHRRYLEGFYLIHAARAFYIIPKVFIEPAKPLTTCTTAFDAKTSQFYCPGTDLRWDRGGHPIGAHAGSGERDLGRFVATVAQDGHILVRPLSW